jgi:hypothetical protein
MESQQEESQDDQAEDFDEQKQLEKLKMRQGAKIVGKPKLLTEKFQLKINIYKGEFFQKQSYDITKYVNSVIKLRT